MGMKHHRPVVYGTIRQCQDCHQSWELIRTQDGSEWHPIHEMDERGRMTPPRNVLECQGEVPTTQERSAKQTSVGQSGGSVRGDNLCYCKQCNGKEPHYPGAKNCHCNRCGGKRQHNG